MKNNCTHYESYIMLSNSVQNDLVLNSYNNDYSIALYLVRMVFWAFELCLIMYLIAYTLNEKMINQIKAHF